MVAKLMQDTCSISAAFGDGYGEVEVAHSSAAYNT